MVASLDPALDPAAALVPARAAVPKADRVS